jgi:hypothetical protein
MNVARATKPSFNRRALATQAMQAATATRAKARLDQAGPICIYGLCETLGDVVRFNNINMEGMYQRGLPPRIHLSAGRPLPRRAYNHRLRVRRRLRDARHTPLGGRQHAIARPRRRPATRQAQRSAHEDPRRGDA